LIHAVTRDAVDVENVIPAVHIGGACRKLQCLVVFEFPLTADAQIQAVIRRETTLVQCSELDAELIAVSDYVVG